LVARLDALKPNLGTADLRRSLQQALDAEPADGVASGLIAVFADGQAVSWDAEASGAWQSIRTKADARNGAVIYARLCRHKDHVLNRCVDSLAAARTTVPVGQPMSLTAVIRNTGEQRAPAGLIRLRVGGAEAGAVSLPPLEPGQKTQASFLHAFNTAGVYRCSVELDGDDDLPLDNQAQVVIETAEQVPILVAQGSPGSGAMHDDTEFLMTALGRKTSTGQEPTGVFRAKLMPAFELKADNIQPYACIVLLNVSSLPPETIKALQDYVRQGGGLWIIAGDRTDSQSFNSSLFADGRGLSPVGLGPMVGDAAQREKFERLRPPAANHPATRLLADLDRLDLDQARIFARLSFSSLTDQKKSSALLATDQGEAIAIEQQMGRGRLVVQTIPLDLSWSNLPICQAFVVMVHEWSWYLVEPSQTAWNLIPGDTLSTYTSLESPAVAGWVTTPPADRIELSSLRREGRRLWRFSKTLWPGPYELVVADAQGNERGLAFQVARDPRESELAALSDDQLKGLAATGGLHIDTDPLAIPLKPRPAAPDPLWSWLVLLAVAALLLESALAGWLARRRGTGAVETQGVMPGEGLTA
jgi:hypothetical protein